MAQSDGAKPISQLQTPKDLSTKMRTLRRGRSRLERDWKLNLAYYKGRQYTYFNPSSNRIESLPVEDGEKPRYRVRIVSNQIITGVQSLLSKYTKTKPIWGAAPGDGSDEAVKAAQMAEALLNHWWPDMHLNDKLAEALTWSLIAGNGYWKIDWDSQAGKPMRILLGPDGMPITDPAIEREFRSQLEQVGIKPEERVIYQGDLRIKAFSPFDVLIDPLAPTAAEARYAFCIHHLDPDEVYSRWGVRVKPDSVSADPDVTLPFGNSEGASDKTVKRVFIGYFRPSPAMPSGRYVVWCDNPEQILYDGPWPYPFNELPIVQFPGIRNPGQIYDDSVVTHARPLQKVLNRTLSQIVAYKNLTLKPRVWAPVGSLRERLTTEPGAVYQYKPINGEKPEIERLPAMPPYVFEHLNDISARLRDVFSLTEVTEGSVPPNVEAGIAIDMLQEMATDRIAPTIMLIEDALAQAGQLMLSLAQQYYDEPRLMKLRGAGGSIQVKQFTKADIAGNISIHVEAGSGLPRTRAGRQARILKLIEMGVIRPEEGYKHLDIADLKGLAVKMRLDEDQAYREHEKIIAGVPLNPEAMQQALAAVNQGVNPDTGEPIQSPEEVQMILERAALTPGIADNAFVHQDIHGSYIKSVEFESHSPDVRRRFFIHYELTQQVIAAQAPQPEPQSPRINTQIKAVASPTMLEGILRSSGVEVPAEVLATEEPLESSVYDSADKPDVDGDKRMQEASLRKAEADAKLAEKKANSPVTSGQN